jgi:hypothetical protein
MNGLGLDGSAKRPLQRHLFYLCKHANICKEMINNVVQHSSEVCHISSLMTIEVFL